MTLFEQYCAAKDRDHETLHLNDDQRVKFAELRAIAEAEGVRLERASGGGYVVCTVDGDEISDVFNNLDGAEDWFENPDFVFTQEDDITVFQLCYMVELLIKTLNTKMLRAVSTKLLKAAEDKIDNY